MRQDGRPLASRVSRNRPTTYHRIYINAVVATRGELGAAKRLLAEPAPARTPPHRTTHNKKRGEEREGWASVERSEPRGCGSADAPRRPRKARKPAFRRRRIARGFADATAGSSPHGERQRDRARPSSANGATRRTRPGLPTRPTGRPAAERPLSGAADCGGRAPEGNLWIAERGAGHARCRASGRVSTVAAQWAAR